MRKFDPPTMEDKPCMIYLADHLLLESHTTVEEKVASIKKDNPDVVVEIVRNAKRHRWEIYLKSEGAPVSSMEAANA